MIKNIFLKHQYRTFVKYNTIKTYKYNNNNNHAVISTIICKKFSNTKNNINAKKKKNNIKYEANKQKRKDQTILIERLKQKCPASLNLLGEMAILETVQPSRYNHNTFIDGLNNARYFFEQVSDELSTTFLQVYGNFLTFYFWHSGLHVCMLVWVRV